MVNLVKVCVHLVLLALLAMLTWNRNHRMTKVPPIWESFAVIQPRKRIPTIVASTLQFTIFINRS